MLFQYASDLHLEFEKNKKFINRKPLSSKADILILAGDIMPFNLIDEHKDFWNYISDHYKYTYWIPGNHEYYGFDAATKQGSFQEQIRSNVVLINNDIVKVEETEFIFSTLWTNIGPVHQWTIQRRMNDFLQIKFNGNPFTVNDYNYLHKEACVFLESALSPQNNTQQEKMTEPTQHATLKKVVITHHIPTLLNYPNKYKNDVIQEGFAVELFDLIDQSNAACWISGHHHFNTRPFVIGQTQMLTNQLGYIQYKEHTNFKADLLFEV